MAGVPAAILVQAVILRMKFIHKSGKTDSGLEHDDGGVTISALDFPRVLFYVRNKFFSCLSNRIFSFLVLNTELTPKVIHRG